MLYFCFNYIKQAMIIILITFPFYSNKIPAKYQKSNSLQRALYRSQTHRFQAEIHQS